MKRILLEILGGLTVLVVMVSFHHQILRIKLQQQDVSQLRSSVDDITSRTCTREEAAAVRTELVGLVDARFRDLESRLLEIASTEDEPSRVRAELEAEIRSARREAEIMKAEIQRDVLATKQLVSTIQDETRQQDRSVLTTISENRATLESLSGKLQPDRNVLTRDLLAPTVQLNGDDTVGSGTLIRSCRDARTGQTENFVITSYHVVRNILTDSPRARRDGIMVTVYKNDGRVEVSSEMVAFDEQIDAALLRLRTDETFDQVAHVMPRSQAASIRVWDAIYAIGCPLGNDPIPTSGSISSTRNVLNGVNYWMINAPTYYGNSGGGVFLAESRQLVGVFSKIYTHGRGNPVVIPHMGLCTPITSIYDWLDRSGYGRLLDSGAVHADLAAPPK